MRKTPLSVRFLFFLSLVWATIVTMNSLSLEDPAESVIVVLGMALGVTGLWLFGSLCADVRAIRERLDKRTESRLYEGLAANSLGVESTGSSIPLEETLAKTLSIRKLGDREFKAHEFKTCSTCGLYDAEKAVCGIDDESLASTTVTAVGCQHWETDEDPTPDNLDSETSL